MTIVPVISETFLRLRRDRIFLPALVVGTALLLLSGLASYWGVEEFFKILYDLGTTAFHLTGAMVAIFWGTKLISDSRQEGSLEVQLASPLGRSQWLVGKFLGLASTLILLALAFLIGWQLVYFGYGMGWMGWKSVAIFSILTLSWLTMGAVAILFSSMSSYAVALFSSVWLLICGLLAAPIMQSMSPETPEAVRKVVEVFAGIWNLHYFNLYEYGNSAEAIAWGTALARLGYGVALIGMFLSLAAFAFNRRDLVGL
ncbi:ABC transporter permease subunit [Pseudobacteriovorax antillogorgiicola]|uniref:ABC-2 family transporter protein n=1 Tax=Pseudobacteriovorax antillogorgiicola TaxID=1513793 RepID=A0A1Y6CWY9_9BACT|nr:ABC transporter permease subunit [Pseudobacteriovorax antillogorgiicola]TCS42243.1 ABC-2 family transporter [Pseudobacteriovorax antillogorgiicola]SMF82570.1 ABC-2 family transporter protein [Pseudobacteriovorax antillogorgiicola]